MYYQEKYETTYESGQRALDFERQQGDAFWDREAERVYNEND